jgi:transcriptional regulator with XRE-family HTH domain
MAVTNSEFAHALIQERKARGMAQSDLMRELGAQQQALSRWELALSLPNDKRMKELIDFFGPDSTIGRLGTEVLEDRQLRRLARAKGRPVSAIDLEAHPSEFVKRYTPPTAGLGGLFYQRMRDLGGAPFDLQGAFYTERQRLLRRIELDDFKPDDQTKPDARRMALKALQQYEDACQALAEAVARFDVLKTQTQDLVP